MKLGGWNIKVTVGALPQKVATAYGRILGSVVGASYIPIAYLGSQVVNGENHAILSEQTMISSNPTKNIVLVILNQRGEDFSVVNIERVLEGGMDFGGKQINVQTQFPSEAKNALDKALGGFVANNIKPFALLATQVTKGIDYIFIADVTPVTPDPTVKVALVSVNSLDNTIKFVDLLQTPIGALGYAFTWLRK